ncbi:hypothetical protein [Pseudoalteromonas rhizosphaerae]|nr:hypothetical protein [Pseudoalteromonas rhizosphaerae]
MTLSDNIINRRFAAKYQAVIFGYINHLFTKVIIGGIMNACNIRRFGVL